MVRSLPEPEQCAVGNLIRLTANPRGLAHVKSALRPSRDGRQFMPNTLLVTNDLAEVSDANCARQVIKKTSTLSRVISLNVLEGHDIQWPLVEIASTSR